MDDDLVKECIYAHHKAAQFHQVLRPMIAGSKASKDAYALKDRVKPWHSIGEKVGRKRGEGRTQYSAENVKDASGFRIVCLFNADIAATLSDLLSVIKTGHQDWNISLSSLAEIEIHSSRRAGDPLSIVADVEKVVAKWGLSDKLKKGEANAGFSSYSSVHVVLETVLTEAEKEFHVHSEIQLRSVFEEAWSEISHRLGYGPDKRAAAKLIGDKLDAAPPRWRMHLDALKSLADGCAQYSDLIAAEARNRQSEPGPDLAPRSVDPPHGGWPAFFATFPPELTSQLRSAFAERDRAEEVARKEGREAGEPVFNNAAGLFESVFEAARLIPSVASEQVSGVKAEMAYCLMHAGEEVLARAESLWREVLETEEDLIAALLRLGQIRLRREDPEEAQALLERAEQKAEAAISEEGQEQRLWVIRRDLGITYWRLSERPLTSKEDKIALMRLSMAASLRAFQPPATAAQRKVAAGNAIYCCAELEKLSPEHRDEIAREAGPLLSFLRDLPDYGDWSDELVWSTMRLDSVMRAESRFGDLEKTATIAEEIIRRIDLMIDDMEGGGKMSRAAAFERLTGDDQDMYLTAVMLRDSGKAARQK